MLRQQSARATAKTDGSLDQPANPKGRHPSLNYQTGCLIVVDTFRGAGGVVLIAMLEVTVNGLGRGTIAPGFR